MVIGILTAVGAATTALTWAMDKSLEVEQEDKRNEERMIRTLTGAAASRQNGETRDIQIDDFVELPPDPAFGGKPALLTHREAVWWMQACQRPDDHIPEIRKILGEQEIRRMACSVR